MKKTIFQTGELEYPDKGLDKPVKYELSDLETIASKTSFVNITDEHSKEVLGVIENIVVEDGVLKADVPENLKTEGLGWSPVFDTELIDMGDYYKPSMLKMTEIGLSKNPRNKILYNNADNSEQKNLIGIKNYNSSYHLINDKNKKYKGAIKYYQNYYTCRNRNEIIYPKMNNEQKTNKNYSSMLKRQLFEGQLLNKNKNF